MEKLSGKICDRCRTVFYPGDRIVELCEKCANTVWCLFNIYEDGSKELSSIHGTEEGAVWFKAQNYELYKKLYELVKIVNKWKWDVKLKTELYIPLFFVLKCLYSSGVKPINHLNER